MNENLHELNESQTAYRLGNYVILAGGQEWQSFPDFGDEGGGINLLSGRVNVDRDLDVTWLSSWKVRDSAPDGFKTAQDVEAALAELPAWNQTRWACKWDDFGFGALIDCKTGAWVDENAPEAAATIKRIRAKRGN